MIRLKRYQMITLMVLVISMIFAVTTFTHLEGKCNTLQNEEISLWPGAAPGSEQVNIKETVYEGDGGNIDGITKPSITAFVPENPSGVSALVLPGGGYTKVVFKKEGAEIAKWLNSFGVTAFVLKYRLPDEGHASGKDVPLQDAERALRIIRANSEKWNINPHKIGVIGFSAGGHLAATLATNYDKGVYSQVDSIDKVSARPDFMVLCYPYISDGRAIAETVQNQSRSFQTQMFSEYKPDLQVRQDTPPTFLVVASDDRVKLTEHSTRFYNTLLKNGVKAELHVFLEGNHGFALRSEKPVKEWPDLCQNWLKQIGILN